MLEEIREGMKKQVNDLREEIKLLFRPRHTADSCADILEYNNQSPPGFKIARNIPTGCTVT